MHISRGREGHTVPAIETLEKMARALELPLYTMYDGDGAPEAPMQSLRMVIDHQHGELG